MGRRIYQYGHYIEEFFLKNRVNLKFKTFVLIFCLSFQAKAFTCEKEFALRSEKEMQVIKSLVQLEAKASELVLTSSSSALSYKQKLKEQILDAQSEIFDLPFKFQSIKNQKNLIVDEKPKQEKSKKSQTVKDPKFTETQVLSGHSGGVAEILQLKDGRVLSVDGRGMILVWDLSPNASSSFIELRGLKQDLKPVVKELKDGRILASGSSVDWELYTPQSDGTFRTIQLNFPIKQAEHIHELSDGSLVVVAGMNLYSIKIKSDGSLDSQLLGSDELHIYALRPLKNGGFITGPGNHFSVWKTDAQGAWIKKTVRMYDGIITDIKELKDGRVATATFDGTFIIWTLSGAEMKEQIRVKEDSKKISQILELSDGRIALASAADLKILSFQNNSAYSVVKLKGHTGDISQILELPDGRVATASEDSSLRIWDLSPKGNSFELIGHSFRVRSLTQLRDGRLVSGAHDRTLRVWEQLMLSAEGLE